MRIQATAATYNRFVREGDPLTTDARDGTSVTIETSTRGPETVVRAIDAAGNITERAVLPVVFPHDRRGCAP